MILNYGLKYSDFDRIVETIPTIRRVLPIREIKKQIRRGSYAIDGRVVGTTEDYADFNLLQDRQRAVPDRLRQREVREFRGPRRRHRRASSFPTKTRSARRSSSAADYYTVVGVTNASASRARPGSAAAWRRRTINKDVYIPLNTCKLRFGERIIDNRSGSRQAEETQLTQITIQVGSMDEVLPTVP